MSQNSHDSGSQFCRSGKRVLSIELQALQQLGSFIGEDFHRACETIFHCQGKVIVMGMGKSGLVARKIAATLASTGTPAFFVHPAEASHGDLGMISRDDIVLALSNSGESNEVLSLIPVLKRLNITMICLTRDGNSSMGKAADIHIQVKVAEEACPLGLAPTSSTTAAMVMGDAIAIALLDARGFTSEDFALSHPGGSLGRKLLLHVSDIMHSGSDIPCVSRSASVKDALFEITRKKMGLTVIVEADNSIAGIFTDGDLRRVIDLGLDLQTTAIEQVMTNGGLRVKPRALAVDALNKMQTHNITSLLVEEQGLLVGVIHLHDMLQAGVV